MQFQDLEVGMRIPTLDKGRITALHIMRWSAATENWHRIHYDEPFAKNVDGLPDVLINGSWKQQVLCQYIKDWVSPEGWLWRIRFRFLEMDTRDSEIIVDGEVLDIQLIDALALVRCAIEMKSDMRGLTAQGEAVAVLPRYTEQPVPYPFDPPAVPAYW